MHGFFPFRVQTLIHFIAYTGTEAVVNRKVRRHSVAMVNEFAEENVSSFFFFVFFLLLHCYFELLMLWNDLTF